MRALPRIHPSLAHLAALVLLCACGANGDGDTAALTAPRTPASGDSAPIATGAPPSPTADVARPTVAPTPTPAAAVREVRIAAKDNFFEPKQFVVPAGERVTLTLVNEGQAVHDWQLVRLKGSETFIKGVKTQLLTTGKSETITFSVEQPGVYEFFCEVHPVEMRGEFTAR